VSASSFLLYILVPSVHIALDWRREASAEEEKLWKSTGGLGAFRI
jgi:hypothetical protein